MSRSGATPTTGSCSGIFAIQQDIAEAVATNVVPKIVARSPAEPEALPNLEAYQHYLAGRQIFDKRMPRYAELAEEQFKKAVAIDPQYAEALAELAIVWAFHTSTAQKAEEAIDRALSLKPGLARAHVAKGLMLLEARRPPDLPGAEAAYRQALTLDPNMVDASNWLAASWRTKDGMPSACRSWNAQPASTRSRPRS